MYDYYIEDNNLTHISLKLPLHVHGILDGQAPLIAENILSGHCLLQNVRTRSCCSKLNSYLYVSVSAYQRSEPHTNGCIQLALSILTAAVSVSYHDLNWSMNFDRAFHFKSQFKTATIHFNHLVV